MPLRHEGGGDRKIGIRVARAVLVPIATLALAACSDKVGATAPTGAPTEQSNQPAATSGTNGIDTTPTTRSTSAPETKQPSAFATGRAANCLDSPIKDLPDNKNNELGIRELVWPDFLNFQDQRDGSLAAIAMDGHVICVYPPIK